MFNINNLLKMQAANKGSKCFIPKFHTAITINTGFSKQTLA